MSEQNDGPAPEGAGPSAQRKRKRKWLAGAGVALVVLIPVGYLWATSLVPNDHSAADMGTMDYGGGPAGGHEHHHGGTSVADLTGPRQGTPDVAVTLTVRQEKYQLASGESVDGFTVNGSSPGPLIRAKVGDLVQVTLVNESVRDGATLHWHGINVPNAEDGVAGVTQDAVPVGGRHVYRYVAKDAGTYWYHSHQVSSKQVRGGLYGSIVISPGNEADVVAAIHSYDGYRAINGSTGRRRIEVPAGRPLRVRVINTDNAVIRVGLIGGPFRVVAVDGREVNQPAPTTDAYALPAGGRVDLAAVVPPGGLLLDAGPATLVLGPEGAEPHGALPASTVDLLTYGKPRPVAVDPAKAVRSFEYRIGRRPGFLDGKPGLWWTINGRKYPDVPMYMVSEGEVVRMRISNTSGQAHPMHLHGHHALVLSRNGVRATGSPWWTDTLEVGNDETYEIAFLADNPGLWMDHCHNLPHASEGLMTHLMYAGVTTPYRINDANQPE